MENGNKSDSTSDLGQARNATEVARVQLGEKKYKLVSEERVFGPDKFNWKVIAIPAIAIVAGLGIYAGSNWDAISQFFSQLFAK